MKYNISQSERKRILEMHSNQKKLLITEQSEDLYNKLQAIIDSGYIKQPASIVPMSYSDNDMKYAIKKQSISNPDVTNYFFINGKVANKGTDGKTTINPKKWDVEGYKRMTKGNEITTQVGKNFFTKRDLINKGIPSEDIDNPKMYERKNLNGIDYYREVQDKNTASKFSQRQKDVLRLYEESGFYPCNEFYPTTNIQQRFNLQDDPRYGGIFDAPVELCKSNLHDKNNPPPYHDKTISTGENKPKSSSSELPTNDTKPPEAENEVTKTPEELPNYLRELNAQKLNKNDCRDILSVYYDFWKNRKEISDPAFVNLRGKAQACVNQFNFGGGIFRKTDDYVEIMTGLRASKGIGPGPGKDNYGRVWRLIPRNK